ncbi:MAG: hypothetical protein ACRDRN_13310 [Sciscionella sp.]
MADHLGWQGLFLSDERREVYTPGTIAFDLKALLHGEKLRTPVEDTRQLGGDSVIRDSILIRWWRPRSPDDRVDAAVLLREVVALLLSP